MDSITLLSGLVIQFYQVPNSDIGVKRLYIFQGQFIVHKLLISSRSNALQYFFLRQRSLTKDCDQYHCLDFWSIHHD